MKFKLLESVESQQIIRQILRKSFTFWIVLRSDFISMANANVVFFQKKKKKKITGKCKNS